METRGGTTRAIDQLALSVRHEPSAAGFVSRITGMRLPCDDCVDKKEELMKMKGFIEDSESDGWVNLTHRVWVSRDVINGHSLSELAERIPLDVPLTEFHFYAAQSLPQAACANMLERVKALDAKPVTHIWSRNESLDS